MQLALYRAERPEVFEDIIGQKQIVRILQNQIKSGTVSQAYLFTGTHGTGKTSTARILAKAVNCIGETDADKVPCGSCANCEAIREGRFVDVIELDAASNNKVDDLRAIIDLIKYPPTIGRYKVVIIDEVHMLTPGAENAFLKTLEEPPEYIIFILATTDPQKVKATIRSRCMQLNFKRVSEDELAEGMHRICSKNGVEITAEALGTIAQKADGSVRDALTILEQCMAAGDKFIDKELVLEYLGCAGEDFYLGLTDAVANGDLGQALADIDEIVRQGKDAKLVLKDWLEHYRNLMITKYVDKADKIINASEENIERLRQQAHSIEISEIERAIRLISEYINIGRYSDRPRILLETAAVRLAGSDVVIEAPVRSVRPAAAPKPSAHVAAPAPKREEPAPRTAELAQAVPEEPITMFTAPEQSQEDLEADMQLARATSGSGDAQEMWSRICSALERTQNSYSMIRRFSQAQSYSGNELTVVVKKNKHALIASASEDIDRTAKSMYGSRTRVSLIPGDIDARRAAAAPVIGRAESEMPAFADAGYDAPSEDQIEAAMSADENFDELMKNLEEAFGMEISITDGE